jgi:ribosomal protein S18 acetylase RimI-like enzyme
MAARLSPTPLHASPEIVDLRRLSARDLDSLLSEESAEWLRELDWDFQKSADLVRRFVDLRALNGCALVEAGEVSGYLYYVLEESKGLIGDLYVRPPARTVERENRLLGAALETIAGVGTVRRVESQLMMLSYPPGRPVPFAPQAASFKRNFMRIDLSAAELAEARVRRLVYLERWSDHYQEAAAQIIAAAYAGHVDGRINDQYRSAAGARRFLYNIVQYPGCGTFFRPASCVALEAATGRLCGLSLASLVAPECGHITQICVSQAARGTGVGYAMLRQSLVALRQSGCRGASLTVTASNAGAVALYERVGFRTVRQFPAYTWEGL